MDVSTAIRRGFRRGNIITIGSQPNAAESAEGLELLNSFWRKLLGTEIGENLISWPVPPEANGRQPPSWLPLLTDTVSASTWWLYPIQNARLLTKITAATTIYFPANPDDGARMAVRDIGSSAVQLTLSGNGRLIEGQATLVEETATAFNGRSWFYRDDLASWEPVQDMTLADVSMPLPAEFDDMWINYLAIQLAPSNSQDAAAEVVDTFKADLARAKARYSQRQAVAVNDPRVSQSTQSFGDGSLDWFS